MKRLLLLAASIISASASAGELKSVNLEKNIFYVLTRDRADALKIDFDGLMRELNVSEDETVTLVLDEDSNLNLQIFDNEVFGSLRADIVK